MSLLTDWLESLSYDLEISKACLKEISPLSSCQTCHGACPEGAIQIDHGKIRIDSELCTSCGVCITVCPVQAIKGQAPARDVVQKYLLFREDTPIPSFMELLYFYKKGIRFIHFTQADSALEERVTSANEWIEAMGMEQLVLTDQLKLEQKEEPKLTRRDFFSKLKMDGKKTVLSTVTPVKWRFNENSFRLASLYKDWAFFHVDVISEKCTLCEACFNICPSHVFEVRDGQLMIDHQKCSGCRLCKDVCLEDALKVEQKVHPAGEDGRDVNQASCSKCGSSFYAWEKTETCHICSISKPSLFF